MDTDSGHPESGGNVQRGVDDYIRTAQPPPAEVLELEFVYEALAHSRRRYIIYSLLSNTEWTLTDLATKLAAWERDIPEDDVTDSERDERYISLFHTHVPKLVDLDIIEFEDDNDKEVIVADENATQVLAVLEGVGMTLDSLQETHARHNYEEARGEERER